MKNRPDDGRGPFSRSAPAPPDRERDDEECFRALVEAGADAVLVVHRDGVIGFANPAAGALLGHAPERLEGQPFGVPVVPGETTEIDVPRADGTVRVAEMRTASTSWRGEPAFVAALRDVTERRQAEEAAREANATLRSFYEASSMMMGVVELIGDEVIHVSSNAAAVHFFGDPDEVVDGLGRGQGVLLEVLAGWIAHYREARRSGSPARFEYAHDAPGGRTWLSVTVGYIGLTPSGRLQFSLVADDVTERRQAEEALREADRRKDEFLAMLAHELRNPLAAVSNAVQLALRASDADSRAWSHEVIRRQCTHLAGLIDDLLDVSRISQGKIRLRTSSLDASDVLRNAVEAVRPLMQERGHSLETSIGPGLLLDADPTRLEQIVVNLLANAAKYTEPGGLIRLTALRDGDEATIAVRDTGIGIDAAMLPRVFEPFTQAEVSIDRSRGGLGIGLTLVQTLTEMHGGRVSATSDGPGRGSEFVVRLPALLTTDDRPSPSKAPEPPPGRLVRVLVVDDNRDAAELTAALLAAERHEVRCVYDGNSALEAFRAFRPDVVLLDIGLPGMDGYQVAEAIRGSSPGAPLLVAVSGYGEDEARHRSRAAGCAHHLVKPVDIDALLAIVRAANPDP
ncbi:ATP-binding protein [Paludisphaera borealis]|uniref:histidine kinase n=1 Tax=Paludisphaera borealis TaxID=1387353 RepID=A0A1U7CST7_9BACT|nr:ATP-binding protein [Paludisphaera borealis]APW61959.1 Autoinducer 2 sensor kinase/phosphatase LuxQ [Paludisphaera borealis]